MEVEERDVEEEILTACRDNGIGFIPYSPLGRGFLAGTIRSRDELPEKDWRRNDPRYRGENFDRNVAAAGEVGAIARAKGVTSGQIALAWLLSKGDDIAPIPGTKRRTYLEENVAAADIRLSPDEVAALDAALPPGTIAGPRYTEAQMAMVDR